MKVSNNKNSLLFNQWRPRIICRIIGLPPLLGGGYGLYLMVEGSVRASAINLFQFGLLFLVGAFLVSLYRRLEITQEKVTVTTRYFLWSRKKVIPVKNIEKITVAATSEMNSGTVGADSGANTASSYYDISLMGPYQQTLVDLNQYILFDRTKEVVDCFERVREISGLTSVEVVFDPATLGDLERVGLQCREQFTQ